MAASILRVLVFGSCFLSSVRDFHGNITGRKMRDCTKVLTFESSCEFPGPLSAWPSSGTKVANMHRVDSSSGESNLSNARSIRRDDRDLGEVTLFPQALLNHHFKPLKRTGKQSIRIGRRWTAGLGHHRVADSGLCLFLPGTPTGPGYH
jgi:hypothetical protein